MLFTDRVHHVCFNGTDRFATDEVEIFGAVPEDEFIRSIVGAPGTADATAS